MGAAFAQDDSILQRYDLAVENLEFAVAAVPGDGVQARDELERAVNALLTLSRDATSTNLVQAMERTFERARTAVENQSRTDLAVQSAVLRGGFRRLVVDSAFTAAAQGDTALARDRLLHIGRAMNFTAADLDALTAAPDATALRLAFEVGTAGSISTELTVADRLQASDRDAAYVSLATAYGDSLLIQDSPRADPDLNQALTAAAQALVNNDGDGMSVATETAEAQLSRLAAAARVGAEATPPGSTPAEPVGATPLAVQTDLPDIGLPQVEPAPAAITTPESVAAGQGQSDLPAGPALLGQLPGTPAQDDAAQTEQGAASASLDDPQFLALAAATIQQRERDAAIDRVGASLRTIGLNEAAARSQATSLVDAGFASAADAVGGLSAQVTSAVAALRAGDAPAARALVTGVDNAYQSTVSGLLRAVDGAVAQETDALFASLASRPVLREHDLTLLAAQVDAVDRSLGGREQAGSQAVELMVDGIWSGWVRVAVFVVLGFFAFVPLRYLNMAFGGGNANWRLVSIALFLLLVPIMYEALAAILSVAADLLDMPSLDVLANWSMFTSTTGQVAWAVLLFIALMLATIGLRGVCVQFGLLGSGRGRTGVGTSTANPTVVDMTRSSKPSAVDWDDEF
jgi:hypothetical protein